MLTKQELLLAARMLEIASIKFSNHGCNDLDDRALEAIENEEALCIRVRAWNGDLEGEWPERAQSIDDSSLMQYLSDQLKGWAQSLTSPTGE